MKIILDDIGLDIDVYDSDNDIVETIHFKSHYQFSDALKQILTPSQHYIFIGIDTRRTFKISDKKYKLLKELIWQH